MFEVARPAHVDPESSFCQRLDLLLASADCRLARSSEQQQEIFRLRSAAGARIRGRTSFALSDRYDYTGDVYLFGFYIGDELASSIRFHRASKEHYEFPSCDLFADRLQSKLANGKVIIEFTHFVADEHFSRLHRELPYATLRFCMLAAEHFDAEYIITAATPLHQTFYSRAFNYKPASNPRRRPDLATPVTLMMLNYATAAERLFARYPFFRSTSAERLKIFGYNAYPPSVC
jgi:hypothetical protein